MPILCVAVLLLSAAMATADPEQQVGPPNPSSAPPGPPSTGTPSTIAVGQRVRVTATTLKGRVDALVSSFDDKSLTVSTKKGGALAIPWVSVAAIDVQDGYRRPLLQSAAFGAALGAVIGLFVHLDETCGTPEETSAAVCTRAESVGVMALGMSAFSFGSQFLLPAEHYGNPKWKRLSPPFHEPVAVSIRLDRLPHGVGAHVTLRF